MGSADFRATVDEAAALLLRSVVRRLDETGRDPVRDLVARLRSGLAEHERAVKEECAGTAANILAVYRRHFSDPRLAEECRSEIVRALRTPPPSPEPVVPPEPPAPVLGTPNNQGPYPAAADTTLGTCCGALVPFVITGHVVPFDCTRPPNHAPDYHVAHGEGLCGYVRIAPTPPAATEVGTEKCGAGDSFSPRRCTLPAGHGGCHDDETMPTGATERIHPPPPPDAGARRAAIDAADPILHPNGRCTCRGEGRREWCRNTEPTDAGGRRISVNRDDLHRIVCMAQPEPGTIWGSDDAAALRRVSTLLGTRRRPGSEP